MEQEYAFKKEVDWSLLNYGIAIPVSKQDMFFEAIGRHLEVGEHQKIKIQINDLVYDATLHNNYIDREKYPNRKEAVQIRYTALMDIGKRVQDIFISSYQYLKVKRAENTNQQYKVPENIKEYVYLYINEEPCSFIFRCVATGQTEESLEIEKTSSVISSSGVDGSVNHVEGGERMSKTGKSIEEQFFAWLSERVTPLQLSDLYLLFPKIETFGNTSKILKEPLFETTDARTIRTLKALIDTNKSFRTAQRGQFSKIQSSINYYYDFLKENQASLSQQLQEKTEENHVTVSLETEETSSEKSVDTAIIVEEPKKEVLEVEETKPEVTLPVEMKKTAESTNVEPAPPLVIVLTEETEVDFEKTLIAGSEFKAWMLGISGVTEALATTYVGAILRCESIAEELSLPSCRLYATTTEIAQQTIDFLKQSQEFKRINTNLRNQLAAALGSFLFFLQNHPHTDFAPKSESSVKSDNQESETSVEADTQESETSVEADTQESETSVESDTQESENSVEADTQESETSVEADTQESETSVESHTQESETSVESDIQESETSVESDIQESETSIEADTLESETSVESDTQESEISVEAEEKTNVSPYVEVFEESFQKGFRINSNIDMKRFLNCYNTKYETNWSVNDSEIISTIKDHILGSGVANGDFVYPVSKLLDAEIKDELLEHISTAFEEGADIIYYKALFKQLDRLLLDQRIYDDQILKGYLKQVCSDQYNFSNDFFSKEVVGNVNVENKLKEILLSYGAPMKKDKIYNEMSNFPKDLLDKCLKKNEFINNTSNEYFHLNSLDFTADELEKIASLIQNAISERQYISHSELTELIQSKYPNLLERFSQYSDSGIRSAIAILLGKKFSFNGKIISDLENHLSKQEIFVNYIKSRPSFTLDEISYFAKEMDVIFSYPTVYANSIRVDQNQFVARSDANFDIALTDDAIKAFCPDDYIPIRGVTSFASLPYAGFQWNSFLLEHYISEFSSEFKLLHAGFTVSSCAGAIVKKMGKIKNFDQLLGDALLKSNVELTEETALEFLYQSGYLARRRYNAITQIISHAKLQKGG